MRIKIKVLKEGLAGPEGYWTDRNLYGHSMKHFDDQEVRGSSFEKANASLNASALEAQKRFDIVYYAMQRAIQRAYENKGYDEETNMQVKFGSSMNDIVSLNFRKPAQNVEENYNFSRSACKALLADENKIKAISLYAKKNTESIKENAYEINWQWANPELQALRNEFLMALQGFRKLYRKISIERVREQCRNGSISEKNPLEDVFPWIGGTYNDTTHGEQVTIKFNTQTREVVSFANEGRKRRLVTYYLLDPGNEDFISAKYFNDLIKNPIDLIPEEEITAEQKRRNIAQTAAKLEQRAIKEIEKLQTTRSKDIYVEPEDIIGKVDYELLHISFEQKDIIYLKNLFKANNSILEKITYNVIFKKSKFALLDDDDIPETFPGNKFCIKYELIDIDEDGIYLSIKS